MFVIILLDHSHYPSHPSAWRVGGILLFLRMIQNLYAISPQLLIHDTGDPREDLNIHYTISAQVSWIGEVRHKNHAHADIHSFSYKACGWETFLGVLPVLLTPLLTISRPARSLHDQERVIRCDLSVPVCVSGGVVLAVPMSCVTTTSRSSAHIKIDASPERAEELL